MARVGDVVLYTLTADDCFKVNTRPRGAFSSYNEARPGDVYPAMIVRQFNPGPDAAGAVQLQVFYDGDGSIWATSRVAGDGQGQWRER